MNHNELYSEAINLIAATKGKALHFKQMCAISPDAQVVVDHYLIRCAALEDMTSLLFDVTYEEIRAEVDSLVLKEAVA